MRQEGKIFFRATASILLGSLLLFLTVDSCERIKFEPVENLYITTDSILLISAENYKLTGSILNVGKDKITAHGFCWSDSGTPTTDGAAIHLGSRDSIGHFSGIITGLDLKSIYKVRAFAETSMGTEYGNEKHFRTPAPVIDSTVTDIDGNIYKVVVIGSQAWMAENLKTTHYADGEAIPLVENDSIWNTLTGSDRAYSWYGNDSSKTDYGALYTWSAAMNGEVGSESNPDKVQGVCPDGWHMPSDAEWNQMHIQLGMNPDDADRIGFLGTRQAVGTKMKGIGTPLWEGNLDDPRFNESGFTALPCGQRSNSGIFLNEGKYAYFWSATDYDENEVWYRYLQWGHSAVLRVRTFKNMGFSVRCVLDE
ncbi:MAG: FISUMP domain-containing protein [Bacteroidota bacterium]